jgi:dihydroxyacetone kinase-like predicted kinase
MPDGGPYTPRTVTIELHELRARDIQSILRRYLQLLRGHRAAIDRLNVYPVPDGDTGTNMTMTVEAVVAAAAGTGDMDELAEAVAHGSLMGAQGNSGIILSQVLRALAATMRDGDALDGPGLVEACNRASGAAYEAVGDPVEGTILTVLREAAEAMSTAGDPGLAELVPLAYLTAEASLRSTPDLLPVLKEAGVVDAGGAGLLLLFASMTEEITGEAPELPGDLLSAEADLPRVGHGGGDSVADLRYEVMFLLDGPDGAGERLKESWADMGGSIVIVGGDGTWNCHIHTDHIGSSIEAGIAEGTPHRIIVTDLLEQAAAEEIHRSAAFEPLPEAAKAKVVEAAPAKTVIVLPNNKNVVPAAEELDALTRKTIHVVPTRSIPQGVATLISYEPNGEPSAMTEAMAAAADVITSGEMVRAVRDARTPAGTIREGDWIGLVNGKVRVITRSGRGSVLRRKLEAWLPGSGRLLHMCRSREVAAHQKALLALLDEVVEGHHEIVTMIVGADADAAVTEAAGAWLAEERPDTDLQVVEGGQPVYPYLIGAE